MFGVFPLVGQIFAKSSFNFSLCKLKIELYIEKIFLINGIIYYEKKSILNERSINYAFQI